MDLISKTLEVFPLHQISSLEIDGKHFCYLLEDIQRPPNQKVPKWTSIPRTGMMQHYKLAIRYSPGFKRDMLVIYNPPHKDTIKLNGMEFKYAMFHGGNDHLSTEGCPITAYNLVDRTSTIKYNNKVFTIDETIVQGTAEKDLFNLVAPHVNEARLFML